MDDILKQKVITFLSLYSTNIGQNGIVGITGDGTARTIETGTLEQVDRIFAHFEEDILATTTLPEEVKKEIDDEKSYQHDPNAKTWQKREAKLGDTFTGKDGEKRTYRVCRKCGTAKWFKGNFTLCFDCNQK